MTDIDAPIAWRVTALPPPKEKLSGDKILADKTDHPSKEEADKHKYVLKSKGWIVSVTPVFLSPQKRGKLRVSHQDRTAPRKFNKNWTIASE